jgi:hypothetical protein
MRPPLCWYTFAENSPNLRALKSERRRARKFLGLYFRHYPPLRRGFPWRIRREKPINWRSIARQALGLGRNAPSMKRDDWLIWISLVWFVGLCGAAAWVLTH